MVSEIVTRVSAPKSVACTAKCPGTVLAMMVWSLASPAFAVESGGTSPLAANGLPSRPSYTAEESAELESLGETVRQFEEQAAEFRQTTRHLIEQKYQQKRSLLFDSYEVLIVNLEHEQRARRDAAIAKFEAFLARYPDDPRYTPDAMFRLSELYFEHSYDEYFQARQTYDKVIGTWTPKSEEPEPEEPTFHYEPTIGMMQRLITEFPGYRLIDGAYYLLGYCLGEQGEEERAVDVYLEMVERYPDSRFAAEVWTRIGEYYFSANELQLALDAYSKVLGHYDSPFYDKAMYKLAWTHYRLADPERSPEEFQKAVDTFVELLDFNVKTKAEGKERGGELHQESVQYVAISYADEQWGSLDKLLQLLQKNGEKPYDRELIAGLGDVYMDQTRFADAVAVYTVVQERFGDHVDAPLIQEKLIEAHERNRNFESAALARAFLARSYSEGSPWFEKHRDNEDAVKNAVELTRKSLYSAALFHHKQAQIHKQAGKIELAKSSYQEAAQAYGDYLRRFPHDRQLYELRFYYAESLYYSLQFESAAEQYILVRDSNADDKFREQSAFSIILSYENQIKLLESQGVFAAPKVLKSSDRPEGQAIAPQEIPEIRRNLVDASDRYAAVAPIDEKVPKVLYKAAEIYYTHDHLDEARSRFQAILEVFPQHEVAEFASNLIIESYLAQKDFAAVEKFTRSLLERSSTPGRKAFAGDLVKFKTGAMFKLAEDLDTKGEWEAAAEMYLKLIEENPDTQFVDSALNNAAVNFEKVKRYDSASKLYERLVKERPKSPLADTALFRVGLNAERFFDFPKAIESYLKLVENYPKSDRRADSIYNAALSLENTQDYERSAVQYQRYCKLFPNRDDAPAVCFRAGAVYEKMGDGQRVISTYTTFVKKYRGNAAHADKVVEAYLKMAKTYENQRKEKDAVQHYQLVVKTFQRSADKTKAAPFAAEAQFALVERDFARFDKLKIEGNGKQQQKALQKKAEALKKVETSYKDILSFKQIDWTLASLFRIGQLYQKFAEAILAAPCPADVKRAAKGGGWSVEEVCDQYKVALEDKAITIEDKAVSAFETTISRAREFQVANKWTKRTLVALNKLRRREWPLQKDAKTYVDDLVVSAPPIVDSNGKIFEPTQAPETAPTPPAPTPAPTPRSEPEEESPVPSAAPATPAALPVATPIEPAATPIEPVQPEAMLPPPPPPPPPPAPAP
ncbi:MAG: hypothetical protein A2341_27145 [Deltaproteobacteria bacterium RIFOXYB12_FULL_58_9]|nr:MAG: hypothetical protein A2341_27145 [Deltaproteobacteria bacterium RIFOXYB12_FULL_58_9]